MGGAPVAPEAVMVAWFWMRPLTRELMVTRKATLVDPPTGTAPPVVPLAPVPRRIRTVRDEEMYSPWSSPTASVLVPALAPDTIRIDPGTNVSPTGIGSFSTTLVAPSLPVLVAEIVYSTVSPGRTAPFGWLVMSETVLIAPLKSGL